MPEDPNYGTIVIGQETPTKRFEREVATKAPTLTDSLSRFTYVGWFWLGDDVTVVIHPDGSCELLNQ